MRPGISIILSPADRRRLEALVGDRNVAQKHVWRARIVLHSADGIGTNGIMRRTGKSKTCVWRWQERFAQEGYDGLLRDKTRPSRIPPLGPEVAERVVALTLSDPPAEATHWVAAMMAKATGISVSSVQRIWRAHGLRPHRVRQFKLSNDPDFVAILRDVVGLYVDPPAHAIVLSVDEKSQIQALDRTQPGLPMKKGRLGTMTHDYKRHGTTCPSHLFHLSQKPWNFASPPDTLSGMHKIIEIFADRAALHTEILALRQQVAVLKRKRPRPSLRKADRVFWVILACLWPGWRHALVIVRPETVIGWHRKGFRLFWTWKSRRGKPGRPPVSREIRYLVRRMSRVNTRWGAPRIHGELLKLGFSISQAAVSKYMVRYPSPPSQSWRTFLTNHADCLASIEFFVVPTATFHLLFGFIVLHHERRQIVHFGVTANPTMAWVAQQIREAFPWGTAPRYLIRDRDGAYGQSFRPTVTAMGVEEVVAAPRSPWQNPYVERLIGSVRRECLDHSIILNERHLRRILGSYLDYYHGSRTHLSLGKDTPDGRPVQPAGSGTVVSLPKVGGLHHRYERLAA